jgi:hypothetical protein
MGYPYGKETAYVTDEDPLSKCPECGSSLYLDEIQRHIHSKSGAGRVFVTGGCTDDDCRIEFTETYILESLDIEKPTTSNTEEEND